MERKTAAIDLSGILRYAAGHGKVVPEHSPILLEIACR